ncbi:MAG TPA: M48 family metallopeptidase [Verrucomicrobiota bacterium]|nr:hypothetical protein [Verrucomicrobiales bacterium]HRI14434.1 M48 family metallopeptidase [Verrucomicrobiota bacterium]
MSKPPSVAGRALMAVGLMVGFYLLAAAIVAVLFYLPYAEYVYLHRLHLKIALLCVVGGIVIAWAVLPRVDRFEAPGPRLTAESQPRLFEQLNQVAHATGQEMPAEVYAVGDINAWVAQRGGLMGFGSRRVMGLGLPLLQQLTVSQFRAVLAHEFGHYFGGDTRLGPWVYKTRAAIGRTVQSLTDTGGGGSLLQIPFALYGRMFMRVTQSVSRQQEFSADALAARTVGARPLIEGLRVVHQTAPAFSAYWQHEVMPVIAAGYQPPVNEGFQRFTGSPKVVDAMAEGLAKELSEGTSDPFDSHPALRERIAALEQLPAGEIPANDPTAISLLDGAAEVESELLRQALSGVSGDFKQVAWEAVGESVYVPQWTKIVNANRDALAGLTLSGLPELARDPARLASRLKSPDGDPVPPDAAEGASGYVVSAAITLALQRKGWELEALPGTPVHMRHAGETLQPFSIWEELRTGKRTAEEWRDMLARFGLSEVSLDGIGAIDPGPVAGV